MNRNNFLVGCTTALTLAALWPARAAQAPPGAWTAPPITAEAWVNSPPLRLEALRGKVVVLEFWTFG